MLARTLMTAEQLGITQGEFDALVDILRRMERGELVYASRYRSRDGAITNRFTGQGCRINMGVTEAGCGTVHCIGGWVAAAIGKDASEYVHAFALDRRLSLSSLSSLYWPGVGFSSLDTITLDQMIQGLSNYLTRGNPCWEEVRAL